MNNNRIEKKSNEKKSGKKAEEERRKSKRIPVGDTTFTIKTLEFGIKRKIAGFSKKIWPKEISSLSNIYF